MKKYTDRKEIINYTKSQKLSDVLKYCFVKSFVYEKALEKVRDKQIL